MEIHVELSTKVPIVVNNWSVSDYSKVSTPASDDYSKVSAPASDEAKLMDEKYVKNKYFELGKMINTEKEITRRRSSN